MILEDSEIKKLIAEAGTAGISYSTGRTTVHRGESSTDRPKFDSTPVQLESVAQLWVGAKVHLLGTSLTGIVKEIGEKRLDGSNDPEMVTASLDRNMVTRHFSRFELIPVPKFFPRRESTGQEDNSPLDRGIPCTSHRVGEAHLAPIYKNGKRLY